jgi:hypothetical protein
MRYLNEQLIIETEQHKAAERDCIVLRDALDAALFGPRVADDGKVEGEEMFDGPVTYTADEYADLQAAMDEAECEE